MSHTQTQSIPGMEATLDFVKNLWGGMNLSGMKIPGMIMPTLSLDEINKQIADLKTVESWLTLNMNMLRSTIQALEVQSATISALQAMGESLSSAVKPMPKAPEPPAAKAAQPEPKAEPPKAEPQAEPEVEKEQATAKPKAKPQADAAALPNPAMWWNMLQDQFKHAVGSAMAPEPAKPAAPKAAKTRAAAAKPKKSAPKAAKGTAKAGVKPAPKVQARAAKPARSAKAAKPAEGSKEA